MAKFDASLITMCQAHEYRRSFNDYCAGQGEEDPDLCYRVNFDGTRSLLEACRQRGSCPRVILTTAGATFSGGAELVVTDDLRSVPATTYGTSKRMAELLLNDYTRKGFIDGRAGRLSSVIVRAGAPNAATTGAYSSVVREPLSGTSHTYLPRMLKMVALASCLY